MASPAKLSMATQGVLAASPKLEEKKEDGPIATPVIVAASPKIEVKEEDDAQMIDAAPDMDLVPRGLGVVAWHVAWQVFVINTRGGIC